MNANEPENEPAEARAALLIKADPSGEAAAIFENVADLSQSDFERYSDAYNLLYEVLMAGLFIYVRESTQSLVRLWEDASKALADGEITPTGNPDVLVSWSTRLRGAVLAVCNSIFHHQERMYEDVSRKFGKNSSEHNTFKKLFAELYDENFGYRYLYKLRNVMVHSTMMAVSLEAKAELNGDEEIIAMWEINMDRITMIESSKINEVLRSELNSKPGDPSIIQMLGEAVPGLRDANRTMLRILNPELANKCDDMIEFDQLFGGRTGVRGLIHQQSPELRPPYTTGFSAFAGQIMEAAYKHRELYPNG